MLRDKTCLLAVTRLLYEEEYLQYLENFLLLGYYAASIDNSLLTFWDNLSTPA